MHQHPACVHVLSGMWTGPDDASSGAGSGQHGTHYLGLASGHSSGCEEEQSGSPSHHTSFHPHGLVPFDSISHHQPCAGSRRNSQATLLGVELSEDDPMKVLESVAGDSWDLTACTSSHPLSHHCPGATNIELLEAPEEVGDVGTCGLQTGTCGLMRPAPRPAPAPRSTHQPQPSGPRQTVHIIHRPPQQQQQQRPRAPPLLAPQPGRLQPSPFVNSSGNMEAPGWGSSSHPCAGSPGTDGSDVAEEDVCARPPSAASLRKSSSGRVIRPARSVPNFAHGMSPRAGYHTAPDVLAPAPKRQHTIRRSPSDGMDMLQPHVPSGPSVAPMAPSHCMIPGPCGGMGMVPTDSMGMGMGCEHMGHEFVGDEEEHMGMTPQEAGLEDPNLEPVHTTGQVEAWVFDPSLPSTEGVVLPPYAMSPHIPPEARPALAALAAMLPPRNNKKRANGGHGSTCARPAPHPHGHGCTACGTQTTPVWRAGPAGPKTLCNACGVRYMKVARGGGVGSGKK